jgi:hypothetical protein
MKAWYEKDAVGALLGRFGRATSTSPVTLRQLPANQDRLELKALIKCMHSSRPVLLEQHQG